MEVVIECLATALCVSVVANIVLYLKWRDADVALNRVVIVPVKAKRPAKRKR